MKNLITKYLCLLVCAVCVSAQAAEIKPVKRSFKEWKLANVPGVEAAWVNDSLKGHMVIRVDNDSEKPMSLKGATTQDIASGISALRRMTLEHLGFTEWKLEKCSFEIKGGVERFDMSGTYLRPDKMKVHFIERQYFSNKHYRQFSYLAEEAGAPFEFLRASALLSEIEHNSVTDAR